ncbi:Rab family GTPase [Piscirickettsia salmonis]|uniref:Rab family GTPase n=1 Tax=Piscirickettsia salmonis TaxID=1238 RepID=UPI00249EB804|nr:ADP-ribosylation factor-like protein [Piscirickettsia salmonis]
MEKLRSGDMPKEIKVVAIGATDSGKTSFLKKECQDYSTMSADFTLLNTTTRNYKIWDPAGKEGYEALRQLYYKDASIALLFIDCSKPDESIEFCRKELIMMKPEVKQGITKYNVVFTKADLSGDGFYPYPTFALLKTKLRLRDDQFVSEEGYVLTSVKNDSAEELASKLKDSVHLYQKADSILEKVEVSLKELEAYRDMKIEVDHPQHGRLNRFIGSTRQRIDSFKAGNESAFVGYERDNHELREALKATESTSALSRLWLSIILNIVTLGLSAVVTLIHTRNDEKTCLPFYRPNDPLAQAEGVEVQMTGLKDCGGAAV